MANKETKAERREAARKARLEAQRRAQVRARKRKFVWGGAGIVAIAAIVVAVLLSGRADRAAAEELEKLAAPAGCEAPAEQAAEGAKHIEPPATVEYRTNPPTSGDHYNQQGVAPDRTGVHPSAIQNEAQVHNLEHGHVGIQYSDALSNEILAVLEEVTRADDGWIFLAPKLDLDVPLAFTSWTWISRCQSPTTPDAVKAFAAKFAEVRKDKGRESSAGTPG